jgi:hypothetical protein
MLNGPFLAALLAVLPTWSLAEVSVPDTPGVEPDVKVSAAEALDVAKKLAAQEIST